SSLGHILWLLAKNDDDLADAEAEFRRGLAYKEIKRETFVAGLEHSLARVAAERGDFVSAYRHYVASTTASIGEGIAFGSSAEQHNSVVLTRAARDRFGRYAKKVAAHQRMSRGHVEERLLNSVLAFVLNDYGEACLSFYERSGHSDDLEAAREHFAEAREINE